MPKIIVTSRYIKPNAHKKFGNYIKYIATREGAILTMVLVMKAMNHRSINLMIEKPRTLMKIKVSLRIRGYSRAYKSSHHVKIRTTKFGFR